MTTEKIYVGIDDKKIELTGEALEAFIAERAIRIKEAEAKAAEAQVKAQAKLTAQAKLAALGLTVEDLQALGL